MALIDDPMVLPCACTTLRKASRAVTRRYDEVMRPSGITATQLALLRAVDREGLVPMSRIAEGLVMDRTTLYRAVNPLLRDGFLSYAPGGSDARAKCLVLTPAGRARMAEAGELWDRAQQGVLELIGPSRWQRISAELMELAALVEGHPATAAASDNGASSQ